MTIDLSVKPALGEGTTEVLTGKRRYPSLRERGTTIGLKWSALVSTAGGRKAAGEYTVEWFLYRAAQVRLILTSN